MLFVKQIQTQGIHNVLIITQASDCVLPLIHIYASKRLCSPFYSNFSRSRGEPYSKLGAQSVLALKNHRSGRLYSITGNAHIVQHESG